MTFRIRMAKLSAYEKLKLNESAVSLPREIIKLAKRLELALPQKDDISRKKHAWPRRNFNNAISEAFYPVDKEKTFKPSKTFRLMTNAKFG